MPLRGKRRGQIEADERSLRPHTAYLRRNFLNGRKTDFSSPRDAIEKGLGMVHQHFMLVDTLSVTENIILGNEPANLGFIDTKAARRRVHRKYSSRPAAAGRNLEGPLPGSEDPYFRWTDGGADALRGGRTV